MIYKANYPTLLDWAKKVGKVTMVLLFGGVLFAGIESCYRHDLDEAREKRPYVDAHVESLRKAGYVVVCDDVTSAACGAYSACHVSSLADPIQKRVTCRESGCREDPQ